MIDHTSLGVTDFDSAIAFYTACLAPLGYEPQRIRPEEAAFGTPESWGFFIYPATVGKIVGERNHVAFRARGRDAVQAFHKMAVQKGATTVRAPGERPDIGPDYFGTILIDPDGHTLEAVYWAR